MSNLNEIIKDEFWEAENSKGQRRLDLDKIFTALQFYLENEETLHKSAVNAGLPYTAIYESYKRGKEVAKEIGGKMENNSDLKNSASPEFDISERESQQLKFYGAVERAKNVSLMRAKKYLGFTLEQAEQEIVLWKQRESSRVSTAEREGASDNRDPAEFVPNPEVLKLIKWLLERRERKRYAVRVENTHEGEFSFNVQFEDLPQPKPEEDLTEEKETPENGDGHSGATEA